MRKTIRRKIVFFQFIVKGYMEGLILNDVSACSDEEEPNYHGFLLF